MPPLAVGLAGGTSLGMVVGLRGLPPPKRRANVAAQARGRQGKGRVSWREIRS